MICNKTINSLCRENEVTDISELVALFQYWLDCGYTSQVVKDFSKLRRTERNILYRYMDACDMRQLCAVVMDIVLPMK